MTEDQSDVVAFLLNPAVHGVDEVEIIETHISRVFLAGNRAYKLKRAVTFPYVDFSTVERRRQACEQELTLNRRTAPELYLETRAIARGVDGQLCWSKENEEQIVDWVVVMRRFPDDARLDIFALRNELTAPLLYRLATHIAEFHAAAEIRLRCGGSAAAVEIVHQNDACLRAVGSKIFPLEQIDRLRSAHLDTVRRLAPLLDRRRDTGKVRRCHGDLHLRNICVVDGMPKLFDCLEFSENLGCIDVLYDLAFLLMDLCHHTRREGANLIFNRYLDLTDESDGLAALPLFISLRAVIRAHVTMASAKGGRIEEIASDALRYLQEAHASLQPAPLRLVAIGGLSGTGKSTLAAALAPMLGISPGARVLRSDIIRKRLFGLEPEAHLPQTAYGPDITARVYAALRDGAAAALRAGYCAIIDAVALRAAERTSFVEVAEVAGVPFNGLWLEATPEVMRQRVTDRRDDASDADRSVVARQLAQDAGSIDWCRIEAGGQPSDSLRSARQVLSI